MLTIFKPSNAAMYSARCILRLCRRDLTSFVSYNQFRTITNTKFDSEHNNQSSEKKDIEILYEKYKDKIIFHSHLESEKLKLGYFKYNLKIANKEKTLRQSDKARKSLPPLPIALKYIVDKERLLEFEKQEEKQNEPEKAFQLPFKKESISKENIAEEPEEIEEKSEYKFDWMTSYEHFDDSEMLNYDDSDEEIELENPEWRGLYGTPDPSIGVSMVPCGGCGALLHCNDPSIPGYLPSEIFKGVKASKELRQLECQRCHFLKEYNIALDVSVRPEEYERLLLSVRRERTMVVLMIDLLDFPCSIWPGMFDIIGINKPLFIVGNKVDLLPGDSFNYLKRIEKSLMHEINKTPLKDAKIKHVSLISAKTGFGVEDLISAMFSRWKYRGDVYLVGCTNVGKSSLFNALLQSDYCKVHAVDIMKRATVSRWPGTTLNLLKFPINRPSEFKLVKRQQRLASDLQRMKNEEEIRRGQVGGFKHEPLPSLIGYIGRSLSDPAKIKDGMAPTSEIGLNEKNKLFAQSKWFYDTPGIVHPDQVLSFLTTEELLLTIPNQLIRPQTYYLHPGSSILIGGLARIDFLECPEACRFTVFCSDKLPITITKTEDANDIYQEFLGTEFLGAPLGGTKRLKNWPGLKKHFETLEFIGEGPHSCCGDIVLSSVAWVSVTCKSEEVCKVSAWTPEARGIHLRKLSVLPFTVKMKGKRVKDTPAYMLGKVFDED